jgi:hypothetical protein
VDTGYGGYSVNAFALSRAGVLYAATSNGIWRTTAPVRAVAAEAAPNAAPEIGVSVSPNPTSGHVQVAVSLVAAGPAHVVVLDVLGREVAVVLDEVAPQGETTVGVDTGGWPAGVYVVRATAGAHTAVVRLVVAR